MKNKVVVTIAGKEYTMVAVEDENYVRRCAAHVDSQLREVSSIRLSQTDSAVLAAMNIADQYLKEQASCENLRMQIKEALESTKRLEMELSDCKREIFRLQNRR